ncbi:MAG: DNA polymerase III subunit gamma/tau [Anaplasma sp.]
MNLALKYRPRCFDDLVGQDVLVRILKNSFAIGSLNSPLLMVGASGVGKTTCARIVALCLNCQNGPVQDPCGTCSSCVAIRDSVSPDVIEIDAASNTGVDDIRSLLENSHYLPTSSRFKVYIIDEVHMLSISAFNALLKTLEDPAQHARFIMATTEARKVPVTVASRCQRLDLLRLSVDQLFEHLVKIAEKEGMVYDKDGLRLIAENSSGSVRNSLFLLEQSFIYTKNNIRVEDVRVLLGCVDKDLIENLTRCILEAEASEAVQVFRKLCAQNLPISVLEGIQSIVYELCVASVSKEHKLSFGDKILSASRADNTSFLSRVWQALASGIQEVKNAEDTQQAGEMVVIRLCYLSGLPSPQKIAGLLLARESDKVSLVASKKKVKEGTGAAGLPPKFCPEVGGDDLALPRVEVSKPAEEAPQAVDEDLDEAGEKKNGVSGSDKMYNPEEDETVMSVVRDFEGASVVGFCGLVSSE